MNKIALSVFSIAIFLGCALNTKAQSFEFGIRYEPEFSALMNNNDANAGSALGYVSHFTYLNFGIGAAYNLNKNVGLCVDVLLSREGQNFTGNFGAGTYDAATYSSVVSKQIFFNGLVVKAGDYVAKAELEFYQAAHNAIIYIR